MTRGTLFLVVGPSGAGKDTLIRAAHSALGGGGAVAFARRVVTRAVADSGGDVPATAAEFAAARAAGGFMLDWAAHGIAYGIPAHYGDSLAAGLRVVANVSRTIVADAGTRFPPVRAIEVTAPPALLAERLNGRGREDEAAIAARLARAVALPDGVPVTRIVNDGPLHRALAAFMAALRA